VKAHAALPHEKYLQRMRQVVAGLVEKAVAKPPAYHHPHDTQKQDVFNVLARPGAGAGDGRIGLVAQAPRGQEEEQAESRQVSQAVPVDADGAELKRDGIDLGMDKHGGYFARCPWGWP
jgi:hypothetical protein